MSPLGKNYPRITHFGHTWGALIIYPHLGLTGLNTPGLVTKNPMAITCRCSIPKVPGHEANAVSHGTSINLKSAMGFTLST